VEQIEFLKYKYYVMNVNTEMLKNNKANKNDRLYDSNRNYIGFILKINLKENTALIRRGIFEYNIDISKLD
tara:strand:- start:1262 stop:1474 length:213 start_codon:yes stop_codon:yes gene_type:complete